MGMDEIRSFWNKVARDWRTQVGDDGDSNRRWNSDPVLWAFLGEVGGRTVLDAGCGTGYLSQHLRDRGASVIGVDLAEEMIAIAEASYPGIPFRVDSVSELRTIGDDEVDIIACNYVLMDTPELLKATKAFFRVLKPGGHAVVVFSHPCFPQGRAVASEDDAEIKYPWNFSYFDERRCVDPPWGHFTSDFVWFHRPLSTYWKTFVDAGFQVGEFEEPRIAPDRYSLVDSPKHLQRSKSRPYSVAFKLLKD